MGRTNIVLDDQLIEKCRKATGIQTKKDLVDHALRQLLRHSDQKKILELRGKVDWQGDIESWRKGRIE
jgi:Arc/MetJ family transcription regulator